MGDVSSYEFEIPKDRVERIEKERLREIQERTERLRRQTDAIMRWTLIGLWFIVAIALTVALTLKASGRQ